MISKLTEKNPTANQQINNRLSSHRVLSAQKSDTLKELICDRSTQQECYCCSYPLLKHVRNNQVYFYCQHCRHEIAMVRKEKT